jgi:hypothetical protein
MKIWAAMTDKNYRQKPMRSSFIQSDKLSKLIRQSGPQEQLAAFQKLTLLPPKLESFRSKRGRNSKHDIFGTRAINGQNNLGNSTEAERMKNETIVSFSRWEMTVDFSEKVGKGRRNLWKARVCEARGPDSKNPRYCHLRRINDLRETF